MFCNNDISVRREASQRNATQRNVLGRAALAAGLCLFGCNQSVPAGQVETEVGALSAEVRMGDEPSPLPIMLRWQQRARGRSPQKKLVFDIENTLDEALEVEIHATTRAGERTGTAATQKLWVGPKSSVTHSIGVHELGLQVTGDSAPTLIAVTYQTADGLQRAVTLPTVWVEHQPGFATARVRNAQAEGRANAEFGLAKLRQRRPSAAKIRDAALGRMVRAAVADDASWVGSHVVTQPSGMPNPMEERAAMVVSEVVEEDDGLSDADRAEVGEGESDEAFDKSGNYKICFKLPYWYVDSGLGEDYLTAQTSTAEGNASARYMYAVLVNSANQWVWWGNLDRNGCTPFVSHANGSYTGWITTSLYRPASNVVIDVTVDETQTFSWGAKAYSISGSGGTLSLTYTGAWAVTDAALVAATSLYRTTSAYPSGTYTKIFAALPDSGAWASGDSVFLGIDNGGFPRAGYKVVVAHEIGHRIQRALYGVPLNDYTMTTTNAACRCDHVTSSNQAHCLQSRHPISAAQAEGWGQFMAATVLNNGSQSNCTFAYYKEFRNDNGSVTSPPVAKDCYSAPRWTESHCVGANLGSEFDWMNFYWRVRNKDGFSFPNFASLYNSACGGSCQGDQTSWDDTQDGADAVFGPFGAKALAWEHQGNFYGVDH